MFDTKIASMDSNHPKCILGKRRAPADNPNPSFCRYTTFSKRKTGIMKKAYELSTLTGTQVNLVLYFSVSAFVKWNLLLQVMLLVASETGHVYTFATR